MGKKYLHFYLPPGPIVRAYFYPHQTPTEDALGHENSSSSKEMGSCSILREDGFDIFVTILKAIRGGETTGTE